MPNDLITWDPLRELVALRAQMDRLFGELAGEGGRLPRRWTPASDILENDEEIVITAELPGVKDEDVHITVHDGVLRIAGERRLEDESAGDAYRRIERSYGAFERTFPLPRGVDEKDVRAGIAYGVLRVRIPKPAGTEPTRIPVTPEG